MALKRQSKDVLQVHSKEGEGEEQLRSSHQFLVHPDYLHAPPPHNSRVPLARSGNVVCCTTDNVRYARQREVNRLYLDVVNKDRCMR
uniref:Uncharacterized protein n=1 Tax=Onchocerca volvulus TaxID=6282 RepID=A0A8R1XVW2_ONCVO